MTWFLTAALYAVISCLVPATFISKFTFVDNVHFLKCVLMSLTSCQLYFFSHILLFKKCSIEFWVCKYILFPIKILAKKRYTERCVYSMKLGIKTQEMFYEKNINWGNVCGMYLMVLQEPTGICSQEPIVKFSGI